LVDDESEIDPLAAKSSAKKTFDVGGAGAFMATFSLARVQPEAAPHIEPSHRPDSEPYGAPRSRTTPIHVSSAPGARFHDNMSVRKRSAMPEKTRWSKIVFVSIDEIEERFRPWRALPMGAASGLAELFALDAPLPQALVRERRQIAKAFNTSARAVRALGQTVHARELLHLRDFHDVAINLAVTVLEPESPAGETGDGQPPQLARFGWEVAPRRTISQREEIVFIGISLLLECGASPTGKNSAFVLLARAMDLFVPARNAKAYDAESLARELRRARKRWELNVDGRVRALLREFRRAPHVEKLGAFVRRARWENWTSEGGLPDAEAASMLA
jgi:hypothetical protein